MTEYESRKIQADRVICANIMSLPVVNPELLRSRLVVRGPAQVCVIPGALHFKRPTQAQVRSQAIKSEPKLEPLVIFVKNFK